MFAALALPASVVFAQVLSLDEALRLGEIESPRLAAQRSALVSAGEQVGRAGALPDPKMRLGLENLPVTGPDRYQYNSDFMTMRTIGLAQEVPNSAKREARNLRAERMRGIEGAALAAQRAALQREIALAWLDAHYAERLREALERITGQFQLQLDAVAPAIARGRQTAADGLALRQAYEQARDRLIDQERMVERSRIVLAAYVGDAARRPLGAAPDTTQLRHTRQHLVETLREHPQLRLLTERESLARAEVDLAKSTAKSDWMIEVGYSQRKPAFDNMVTLMLSFDLPWDTGRRQDRDIASRLAEVEQARAMREDARRMHEAEVLAWLADFDTAARRIGRYEATLIPLARERIRAALAAYEGGRGELAAVLEARRSLTEAEVGHVQALAERAKAWASLSYLIPHGNGQ